ncbi:lipase maturation factor 2 isoform X2 [Corapipo altera]|uniref:lipase maturation factor 2 isoform X2 n=1 Tax=Corapipo altera TaxID=415028 RepID=UPI000FD62B71|nr:lipase maturation factor 2 isoform X2 [Corapipo altera]
MFASGSGGLGRPCPEPPVPPALTYHYETQCIPTPGAWLAHQLPVWFQKLSVVATYVIEVAVPVLFFAPLRRLRLFAFYCQVLLQVLIILTGNYNFFNALTIVLAFSLLDEEHVGRWLGRPKKRQGSAWPPSLGSVLATLLELNTYGLLLYWTVQYFGLEINWDKKLLDSKVAFTYHEFTTWLRTVTLPLVGVAFLSLSWEILLAMYRCACVRGCFWKLWATLQWAIMATATVSLFAVSLVPFTYIEHESNGKLWPGIHRLFGAVERFQVVNSYGLFRRMTGVGGRPEVVLEGSYDGHSWTEIEFMYKPGNVSVAPAMVAPHQPRLDWQLWFAALGHHHSSPWFSALVLRLLQGQRDVIRLVQVDESRYPFSARPPTFLRAQLYKYWFTGPSEGSPGPAPWWRRQHVQEFFPTVSLGDPTLESLLSQHGLKDKPPVRRRSEAALPWLLGWVRGLARPFSGPAVLWTLYLVAATVGVLRALGPRARGGPPPPPATRPGGSGGSAMGCGERGGAGRGARATGRGGPAPRRRSSTRSPPPVCQPRGGGPWGGGCQWGPTPGGSRCSPCQCLQHGVAMQGDPPHCLGDPSLRPGDCWGPLPTAQGPLGDPSPLPRDPLGTPPCGLGSAGDPSPLPGDPSRPHEGRGVRCSWGCSAQMGGSLPAGWSSLGSANPPLTLPNPSGAPRAVLGWLPPVPPTPVGSTHPALPPPSSAPNSEVQRFPIIF